MLLNASIIMLLNASIIMLLNAYARATTENKVVENGNVLVEKGDVANIKSGEQSERSTSESCDFP
jgi:hypothetical protein